MKNDFVWWRDGIIYQIYPRSFADSNNDGIGDLQGIINKLDYLVDLGIDAIWLSPIFPSPDMDFGYDVANYTEIDEKFGTMNIFDQMINETKKRNIRVILDLVLNHTSSKHPWFLESKKSKNNPYHDWYIWQDPKPNGDPPNNWKARFGGSGWEYDKYLDQYYYHMFYKEQPDLNWRNPKVRKAMLNIFRFWLSKGVDGFRLDVFNAYFKHPEFIDNPRKFGWREFNRQEHIYDVTQPEIYPLLAEIRAIMDEYKDTYVVGETFLGDSKLAASFCGNEKLHAAFNFKFTKSPWDPKVFEKVVNQWYQALGNKAWPNNVLSNHDLPRSATRYCKDENDSRAKVASAMLLTLKGTPFLYYGEEIGMRNIPIRNKSEVKDRLGKTFWPFRKGRDGCRSPMQWNSKLNSGFSKNDPWLPVNSNFQLRNVVQQSANPDSLLNFIKKVIKIRRAEPALQHGNFKSIFTDSNKTMVYKRALDNDQILVILNFSNQHITLTLPEGNWKSLFDESKTLNNSMILRPNQVEILKNQTNKK